jgi:hypothetical protein
MCWLLGRRIVKSLGEAVVPIGEGFHFMDIAGREGEVGGGERGCRV